jgi:hypothetical protein
LNQLKLTRTESISVPTVPSPSDNFGVKWVHCTWLLLTQFTTPPHTVFGIERKRTSVYAVYAYLEIKAVLHERSRLF